MAVSAAAAALPATASAVTGGTRIDIEQAPWQVHLAIDTGQGDDDARACGGVILDANHVLTAAHCVIGLDGNVVGAGDDMAITVTAGVSTSPVLEPGDDARGAARRADDEVAQVPTVETISVHPGYTRPAGTPVTADAVDDVAVLTLRREEFDDGTSIDGLDLSGDRAKAVRLPAASGPNPDPGTPLSFGGFGVRNEGDLEPDGLLYRLDTGAFDAALPPAAGGAGGLNALISQARTTSGSACDGDDGSGLVQGDLLLGIYSDAPRCGAGEIGAFSAVTAGEVLTFVRNAVAGDAGAPYPRAPRGGTDPSLNIPGGPRVGGTATCSAGTWSNDPAFAFTFVDTRSGAVLQSGPSAAYALTESDVGRTIACRATATTPGGVGRTQQTSASTPVTPADVAPLPQGPIGPGLPPVPPPTPPAPLPTPARLEASVTSGSTRVRQGRSATFRITVRNTGQVAASRMRICARVGARFSIASRGGATLRGGRLCWDVRYLGGVPTTRQKVVTSVTRSFSLRADRDATPGRSRAATVTVTAPGVASVTTRRTVTIKRGTRVSAAGGVTG